MKLKIEQVLAMLKLIRARLQHLSRMKLKLSTISRTDWFYVYPASVLEMLTPLSVFFFSLSGSSFFSFWLAGVFFTKDMNS
jgi:hypothetical protein